MNQSSIKMPLMLKPLSRESIGEDFGHNLSTQDYSKKRTIDGVQLINLNLFVDDGGALSEIARFTEEGNLILIPEFKIRQATFSQVVPGAIKAFHLHYNQEDLWFVLPGDRLLIGLFDARKGSPSYKNEMRFVMGAGRAQALYIPRGVAHGMANPYEKPANMIYFVNQAFNPEEPDEHRIPWDVLGADFWNLTRG